MAAEQSRFSLHFDHALLPGGWAQDVRIAVADGRISGLQTGVKAKAADERHGVVVPGMPNLHSHAFQRAMAGMAECRSDNEDGFWSWREAMYRFVGQITPEQMTAIAAMAQVEMLESGFTRVGEFHYLHHDLDGEAFESPSAMSEAVFEAAAETGIAMTHLPVFYAYSGFGRRAPEEGQRRFITDLETYAYLLEECRKAASTLPDAVVGIAPHSLRAVEVEQLYALKELAAGAPIHIHIAEQSREVVDCINHYGTRPVEWLLDHAPVGPEWCLVHATHVVDREIAGMAASGAVVGLCPITEANLGDGIFPAAEFLSAGGRIGIGSDSNIRIDMTEELRLLEYGQRLSRHERNVLASDEIRSTGRNLFDAALAGGAQALGIRSGIEMGAPADFMTLDTGHSTMIGKSGDGLIDSLIFAGGRSLVADVWRHGRHVVSDGRHIGREGIESRFRDTMTALLA